MRRFTLVQSVCSSREVDILHLLNLSSGTPGVSVVEGPAPGVPAYKLRVNYGNVRVATPDVITAALTRPPGFTAVFVYRQHRKTLGTLLSVHSPGRLSPWFQLTSNLRTGQLVMHYRITTDEKLHQNSWPLQQPIKKNALLAPDQRKAVRGLVLVRRLKAYRGVGLSMDQIRTPVGA
uniref:Uncharacterized protein n=1 Tax=Timema genevievae TaxID=629358 RepID=A0A7R9JNT7_TIMGE|nr:unnamed protein product [Timema genevievae]